MCDCERCRRSRRIDERSRLGDADELRALIDELLNALIETEDELSLERYAAMQSDVSIAEPR